MYISKLLGFGCTNLEYFNNNISLILEGRISNKEKDLLMKYILASDKVISFMSAGKREDGNLFSNINNHFKWFLKLTNDGKFDKKLTSTLIQQSYQLLDSLAKNHRYIFLVVYF